MHYRLSATGACNRKSRGPKWGPEALNVLEWHRLPKCTFLNFETLYLTLLYYHYSMLKHPFYEQQKYIFSCTSGPSGTIFISGTLHAFTAHDAKRMFWLISRLLDDGFP